MTNEATTWRMRGTVTQSCNCDYGCPCNFNAPPTHGHCEGAWNWHVDRGNFGDVALDGLSFTVAADWPGAIHEGNGEAVVLIDERADERQRAAIQRLVEGGVGGPWAIISKTIARSHGPKLVPYEVSLDGVRSAVRAGDALELEMEPIRNPISGAEVTPGVVLPQGFVYHESTRASSRRFAVHAGAVEYAYRGTDAAVAPFAYSGPQ